MSQFVPDRPILEISDLKTHFLLEKATIQALRGVDLTLPRGTTLGLVGESGCGKTVLAKSILRLVQPPGKIVGGKMMLVRKNSQRVVDILQLDAKGPELRSIRGGDIAIIFQEPMNSLSPHFTVGEQIVENVMAHEHVSKKMAIDRAQELLAKLLISSPKQCLQQYPHQLSLGMRQRSMIALALSCSPAVLIADEPMTALDGPAQARAFSLMSQLKEEFGASILLITHDMEVISYMAGQVAVMYLGKIVELSETRELFLHPLHPYTDGLVRSIDGLNRRGIPIRPIPGMAPGPTEEIQGCAFTPRCPRVMPICREEQPPFEEIQAGHSAACWLYQRP